MSTTLVDNLIQAVVVTRNEMKSKYFGSHRRCNAREKKTLTRKNRHKTNQSAVKRLQVRPDAKR